MNNCIKLYSKETEKHLTQRLKTFVKSFAGQRAVWVTLTTVKDDPRDTKDMFKRWLGRIRYRYKICGPYVLEFNKRGQVHYHLVLLLGGALAGDSTATVADTFWDAWKPLGDHIRDAFEFKPADLRHPAWILSYMTKADLAPGVPHPDRWQKDLPARFEDRGLGARWWGMIGRSDATEMPLDLPRDDEGSQFGDAGEEAA
jgi:hypothetical protein